MSEARVGTFRRRQQVSDEVLRENEVLRARVAALTDALSGAVEALGWAGDYVAVDWPQPYRVENFRAVLDG
jgi:hypothetical protein